MHLHFIYTHTRTHTHKHTHTHTHTNTHAHTHIHTGRTALHWAAANGTVSHILKSILSNWVYILNILGH